MDTKALSRISALEQKKQELEKKGKEEKEKLALSIGRYIIDNSSVESLEGNLREIKVLIENKKNSANNS